MDKVRDIIGLYLSPPDRALVLCVDEKSQIQALDRSQPVLPMLPGMPERCTHDLARNTRASYRDTFSLLLPFVSRKLRKPVDRLAVRDLTSKLVLQFLVHLEKIAAVPFELAISGLQRSGHLPASSAAATQLMSNGAAISGPLHRRSPCRHRSDG